MKQKNNSKAFDRLLSVIFLSEKFNGIKYSNFSSYTYKYYTSTGTYLKKRKWLQRIVKFNLVRMKVCAFSSIFSFFYLFFSEFSYESPNNVTIYEFRVGLTKN